jgi:hypothetical protein
MMWARAWQSSPCGTWPDNDLLIAARIGMEDRQFKAHRDVLMRGWYRSSDGRLYHPTIVELVLKMCKARAKDSARMAAWRSQQKQELSEEVTGVSRTSHGESHVSHASTTPSPSPSHLSVEASLPPRQPTLSADLEMEEMEPDEPLIPKCPHAKIIALYHEVLPELPRCRLTTKARPRKTLDFWKFVFTNKRSDGTVRAKTSQEALDWIRQYFERARLSPFIMGTAERGKGHEGWEAGYDYVISEKGRIRIIENTRAAT